MVPPNFDYDLDEQANGVDRDSDGDGLWDDEEKQGWNVSIFPAWVMRENVSAFLNDTGDINWSKFPLWWNSSDPYKFDTDNDSLNDYSEFWNGTNPRRADTDVDNVGDADDWIVDENQSQISLRTVQDFEGPEITVTAWTFVPCTTARLGDCANLTLTLRDTESGVYGLTAQHIGSGWSGGLEVSKLLARFGAPQAVVNYWMEVPISGVHDRMGTFRILLEAKDWLGNENSTIFAGGAIFEFYRAAARSEAWPNGSNAGERGWALGYEYGKDSGALDPFANIDNILAGRVSLEQVQAAMNTLTHMAPELILMYERTYVEYMRTLALQINPYVPSEEDLINLMDLNTTLWMRDHGAQLPNASAWLRFAKAFWDGSVAGGVLATAAYAVGGVLTGSLAVAALKALPLSTRTLAAIRAAAGKAINTIGDVVGEGGAKALHRASLAAARMWTAMKAIASYVEGPFHRLWLKTAMKLGPDAMTGRALQAFSTRLHEFARWWGISAKRIVDAAEGVAEKIAHGVRLFAGDLRRNAQAIDAAEESATGTFSGGWRVWRPQSETWKIARKFSAVDESGRVIRGDNSIVIHMNNKNHFVEAANKFNLWIGGNVDCQRLFEMVHETIQGRIGIEGGSTASGLPTRIYATTYSNGVLRVVVAKIHDRWVLWTVHPL